MGMPTCNGYNTTCIFVDKATKMCHFVPCTDTVTAKQTAKLFWHNIGKLHGIPNVLISDRDPRFTGKFWKELWRIVGTDLHMGSGFHPESSGQIERFNQLLEQTISCTAHQTRESGSWVDMLPVREFAVNNTPNRMTGYTAFYLNYGYHPLNPIQMLSSTSDTSNEAVSRFVSRMQNDFAVAQENLQKATLQMRAQEESHRRSVEFNEGDLVLLSTRHLRFRIAHRNYKEDLWGRSE